MGRVVSQDCVEQPDSPCFSSHTQESGQDGVCWGLHLKRAAPEKSFVEQSEGRRRGSDGFFRRHLRGAQTCIREDDSQTFLILRLVNTSAAAAASHMVLTEACWAFYMGNYWGVPSATHLSGGWLWIKQLKWFEFETKDTKGSVMLQKVLIAVCLVQFYTSGGWRLKAFLNLTPFFKVSGKALTELRALIWNFRRKGTWNVCRESRLACSFKQIIH